MNKKLISFATMSVLAISCLAGCGAGKTTEDIEDSVGVNVTVEAAFRGNIDTTATYTGTLTTRDMAYVTSKVSAKVKTINAEIGDWVEKGDVLVVLDSTDYEYQLRQAEASYEQANAAYNSASTSMNNVSGASEQSKIQLEQALNSAKLNYDNAKTNFERQEKLYEMGAISLVTYEGAKTALENARMAYETAEKNYDIVTNVITPGNEVSAKSGVETAQAAKNAASLAINQAREYIANTKITAPISGYISSKSVVMGQFAAAGSPLFTISNAENIEAEIYVTESVIPYITEGSKAQVKVASASVDAEGKVSVVNPVKDSMTGMYTVRVSVPNENGMLKIGMFADITLYTDQSAEDVVCVPSSAIMQEGSEYYLFVANGNTAEKRVVTQGVSDGEYTEIIEGVESGESIICEGKEYVTEANNIINIIE